MSDRIEHANTTAFTVGQIVFAIAAVLGLAAFVITSLATDPWRLLHIGDYMMYGPLAGILPAVVIGATSWPLALAVGPRGETR
jgi:hypothetical protein